TYLRRIRCFYMALFLADERPNFVALNMLAAEIMHLGIHQGYAAFASKDQQPKNRVAVEPGNPLCAPNASSLNQQLNRQQRLIFGNNHVSEKSDVFFGVRLSALRAAKALETVAVRPVLSAFQAAQWAIHSLNIQQPLAVCQGESV